VFWRQGLVSLLTTGCLCPNQAAVSSAPQGGTFSRPNPHVGVDARVNTRLLNLRIQRSKTPRPPSRAQGAISRFVGAQPSFQTTFTSMNTSLLQTIIRQTTPTDPAQNNQLRSGCARTGYGSALRPILIGLLTISMASHMSALNATPAIEITSDSLISSVIDGPVFIRGTARVQIVAGGFIRGHVQLDDFAQLEMIGGQIAESLTLLNNTRFHMNGGVVGDGTVIAYQGGETNAIIGYASSAVVVDNGEVRGHLHAYENGSVAVRGGVLNGWLIADGSSIAAVNGNTTVNGNIVATGESAPIYSNYQGLSDQAGATSSLSVQGRSTVNMSGGHVLGQVYVGGICDVLISGGTVNGSVHAFGAGQATLSGGSVAGDAKAVGSATVFIDGPISGQLASVGGHVGGDLAAYDTSSILVAGGIVSGNMVANGRCEAEISGGQVGRDVTANDESNLKVSGGDIGGSIGVVYAGTVAISGGRIEGDVATSGQSKATISGGLIVGQLQTYGSSTVALSGGQLMHGLQSINFSVVTVNGSRLSLVPLTTQGYFTVFQLAGALQDGTQTSFPARVAPPARVVLNDRSVVVLSRGRVYSRP